MLTDLGGNLRAVESHYPGDDRLAWIVEFAARRRF